MSLSRDLLSLALFSAASLQTQAPDARQHLTNLASASARNIGVVGHY